MSQLDDFTGLRSLLFTVAYEILGSAADAEDVVQESYLRWADTPYDEVRDPRAYLVRVVTRQALNRARTVARRREAYVGPWLPEPLLTSGDVADQVELADSVSYALLVVLDTLSPLERATFVLREVFGFGYDEIAAATERSEAAVRKLVSRARKHVAERRPAEVVAGDAGELVERFFAAAAGGDLQPLMDALSPDVVLISDGGGKRSAALRPIVGVDKVLRFLFGVMAKAGELTLEQVTANGGPALALRAGGGLDSVVTTAVRDGRVTEIYLVRNPDKHAGMRAPHEVSLG